MTYQVFKKAFFWNSINVLAYKIILQLHQFFLFYYISKALFGVTGILFSSIYLIINITNFGFDYSLFAFYRFFIQSKQHCRDWFWYVQKRCIILIATLLILVTLLLYWSDVPKIAFIMNHVSTPLLIILVSILISESLKKTLELFAQLSFLNKTITILDLSMLCCYVCSIWTYFFWFHSITLYTIFIPMAITSWIELACIGQRIAKFYQTLPDQSDNPAITPPTTMYKNQAVNYCNQIAKAIFSPNFLIIFISYHIGIIQAGFIKLIVDSIILLYMLLNKAIGIPSAAIMSLQSNATALFLKISNLYIQFLYGLALCLSLIIISCTITTTCFDQTMLIIITLFIFIGFLEYLLLLYDKLFLTYHKEGILAVVNSVSIACLILSLQLPLNLPPALILLPFAIIRLACAIVLIRISQKIWHLNSTFTLRLKTVLISLLAILPLFFLHFYLQKSC